MKDAKSAPGTKSETFILTIKKPQRFEKSLFIHCSQTDGEDHRTCHSCITKDPKSRAKPWIKKIVEAL